MFTYEQYKLIKKITKHPGKAEAFYVKRYGTRIKTVFEKARDSDFVDYETTGFSGWEAGVACGIKRDYNNVWIITESGESVFDEYKEHRRDLWSGRIFSIIVSVVAAVLSFIGSVIFQLCF